MKAVGPNLSWTQRGTRQKGKGKRRAGWKRWTRMMGGWIRSPVHRQVWVMRLMNRQMGNLQRTQRASWRVGICRAGGRIARAYQH